MDGQAGRGAAGQDAVAAEVRGKREPEAIAKEMYARFKKRPRAR